MPHLNIYISRSNDPWIRRALENLAGERDRSLSYLVEEALVSYLQSQGKGPEAESPSPLKSEPRVRRS